MGKMESAMDVFAICERACAPSEVVDEHIHQDQLTIRLWLVLTVRVPI